ncbi:MAG: glycosyltransferase family 4 protein [Planctomycetes bacterium]|nr:glycosyltransferase family 4 protein [Planctomycetota bacterium]
MSGIQVIPHGVDAAMHEEATPDAEITAWKGGRPAVLFCGGMVWRKGFDVFLQCLLAAWQKEPGFCVVVKSVGQDQHYGRFHLGELLARFRATKGTPPLRIVDGELTRAQLASLYTACDLMVHPYRGEGFCLPVAEARACGLPVLATAGGATEALMAGPGAIRIPSARRSLELPTPHVAMPWVFEPSAKDAGDLLAASLRDLPALRAKARAFARNVRSAFPWSAAAAALEELAFAAAGKRREAGHVGEPVVTLPQVEPRRNDAPAPVGS